MTRLTIVALLLIATTLQASERYPHGRWSIGVDGVGSSLDDGEQGELAVDEQGQGAGLRIGFLLSPALQVRLHSSSTEHETDIDDVKLSYDGATIDAVYLFRQGHRLRPYVSGGAGGYMVTSQQDALTFETDGFATTFGVGAQLQINRRLGLHAQARYLAVNWLTDRATLEMVGGGTTVIETPIAESGSVAMWSVGGTFHF